MKNAKFGVTMAPLVLIPPMIGTAAYLATFRGGLQYFLHYFPYIASASLVCWPLSLFLNTRTFIAGLLGLHAMMAYFLFAMSRHWGDDFSWILYLPNVFAGLIVGIIISVIAKKANQWIQRTPP